MGISAGNPKERRCGKRLIIYEIRNLLGNPFVYIFGIFFPLLLLFLITKAMEEEVPEAMLAQASTSVFITMSLIIPMAVVLLGYTANYSQELEKEIPLRMELFGYSGKSILLAKVIAHSVIMAAGLLFYTVIAYSALDLEKPEFASALCLILCLFLVGGIFFALAHSAAIFFKKFGPTYAVMMALYFGTMILCGMMGVKTEMLPGIVQKIAALLPMSYISNDFINFWTGGSYNFMPMIQAFLFLGSVAGIVLILALQREKRSLAFMRRN